MTVRSCRLCNPVSEKKRRSEWHRRKRESFGLDEVSVEGRDCDLWIISLRADLSDEELISRAGGAPFFLHLDIVLSSDQILS